MNQKQILQEEFFANPSSVDIESEEFNSLPPEVRHEILTDMKEITKRRRTLFEAMPEDSGDFSQYQLKGLLKKNSLNKCIDNVRKEINQQYTGEVQAQFEAEGGFLKEVETRRLVSEDTSHYILIKGINSKEDKKNDDLPTQTVDFNSTQGPKTYLDLKLASARKPKASQTSSGEAAPPSPRTLFAIQEAMMEISSDEELEEKKQPLSEHVGNVSPRTMQAISQVLAEDEAEQSKPKEMLQLHAKERKNRKAMLLVISSSDEEDDRLSTQEGPKTNLDEPFKDNNRVPSSVTLQKSTGNCTFEFTDSQIHHLSNKQNEVKLSDTNSLDINSLGIQNEVSLLPLTDAVGKFADVCASLPSINNLLSVTSVVDSSVTPVNANSNRTIQFSSVLKLQTNIGKQDHSPNTAMDSLQSFDETTGIQKMLPSPFGSSATSVSDLQLAKGTTCTEPEMLQSCSNIVSITQTIKPLEVNHPKEDMENFLTKNDLGAMYVPMTPESIVDRDGEYQTNKEEESDSDGSFIEVESCLSSNNKQHMDIREADDTQETSSNLMVTDAIPSKSQDSSVNNLAECFGDDGLPREPGKPLSNEDSRDAESAENEWQDINLNELESLENNLFVQQTSLQAQRQQQERIAASVTGQMYIESQELLRLFGIPFIVAPMEAEAQCAVLDLTDQTSGTITDDSDVWLFGARHVYKNFFTQNKYVEYYQYSDIHNQLGLDRSKFINLAYLLGSDYTEGIPAVGYVSAMEILNEFPGQGLESLLKFKEWWTDAYQNKKMRPNPNDTKVKKKLRELELHPSFPNPAVANAYLKPVVDESKGAFFWGRPDLEQIREFCESRFGWYQSKTDEVLLPVLKQLNTQQTQLRIDSFFRLEQHETIGLKSQRLRRAVTCMKRKEREKDEAEVEAASTLMKSEFCGLKGRKKNTDFESV
ncbi:hypothetical protein GDO86_004029 [Hymenochirus boettgeri]|uniref:XPG-I domain-containing protein n=2 Tax=Hymenochirus boettgeri TaxID=247094 RepID=A0A8T2K8W3_9PIPI|nr:hypothetical protein GDO86_004029 [Hymenochirus boettgeri]